MSEHFCVVLSAFYSTETEINVLTPNTASKSHFLKTGICDLIIMLSSAAFIMPANLENSAVDTGLEMVSFHSNPKERQCQRPLLIASCFLLLLCLVMAHAASYDIWEDPSKGFKGAKSGCKRCLKSESDYLGKRKSDASCCSSVVLCVCVCVCMCVLIC